MLLGAVSPVSPDPATSFERLRHDDARLSALGFRLFTTNAPLCRALQPELGVVWQAIDQFDPASRVAARAAFGFESALAVEAVVPGSPAARAGVAPNDSLVAIDGAAMPDATSGPATTATRDAVESRIASLPAASPMTLTLRRGGRDRSVVARPVPGCRTELEMVIGKGWLSDSDGVRIRIGSRFLETFDDDRVAVVLAHELAHTVLGHRRRLDAAGARGGLAQITGRSGRLIRATEDEADLLGVSLLYNAGYDPTSASHFWAQAGPVVDGGLVRDGTHRSPADRARRTAAEAATIPSDASRPHFPPLMASRDTPLH